MAICIQIRSIYVISLFLFLICPKTHAETNPNAQKISITSTLLNGYDLHHPEISPNDSLIAFSVSKKGTWQKCTIWIQEIASGKVWQVTDEDSTMGIGDVLVRWSPDMTKLAFTSDRGNSTNLYVANLKKSTIKKITTKPLNGGAWGNRASWTPDSKKVVAIINAEYGDNLHYIDVHTHETVQISQFTNKDLGEGVDLSKDGKTALYRNGTLLESFDIESKTTKNIECDIPFPGYPTWSPDKKWIGFQHNARGWKTSILPAEGGKSIEVGPGSEYNSQVPSWTSDNQELFYHDNSGVPYSANIINVSTKQEAVLVDMIENVEWDWGRWSSDSRQIVLMDGFEKESNALEVSRLHILDIEKKELKYLASVPMTNWNPAYKLPVWLSDNSGIFSIVEHEEFPELAFISLPDGTVDVLTHSQTTKHSIAISPDQELIAYISGDETDENIWIHDVILGESYQLTNTTGRKAVPAFSPSGNKLLFYNEKTESELIIVDIDNGHIHERIDINGYWEFNPTWLDEETISFTSGFPGYQYRVCVIRSFKENKQDIVISANNHLITPIFLHENRTVLYQVGWPFGPLYKHDVEDGNTSIFADIDAHVPMVSPDGKFVAYLSPLGSIEATSIWRENVAHIVSQNRLP
jgi:Tol biopolymer transport system component